MGLALLLLAGPSFAQLRVEPLLPRLSPAPAFSPSLPSISAAALAPALAAPAPLFAPALSALAAPAAAGGPKPPAKAALSSIAKAAAPDADDADLPSRSLNVFWDGLGQAPSDDKPPFALPQAGAGLLPEAAGTSAAPESSAPWLALHDKSHAAALEAAVKLARSTKAGRRAFAAAEAALDGAALPVDVRDLGRNYGEFDYLDGRLRLDLKMFAPGREAELAGTLAHELTHAAQHARGLISNALELEIEAHLLDLELMEELGVTPPPHTFARQAQEALAQGPKKFIELMQAAVPGSPFLGEQDFADIADQLEQDLDSLSGRKSARAAKLAAVVENDLKTLRSKKGRAAYRDFSERVLAELARRSAAAR